MFIDHLPDGSVLIYLRIQYRKKNIEIPDLSEETYHIYIKKEVSIVTEKEKERKKDIKKYAKKIYTFQCPHLSSSIHLCSLSYDNRKRINKKFLMFNLTIENY